MTRAMHCLDCFCCVESMNVYLKALDINQKGNVLHDCCLFHCFPNGSFTIGKMSQKICSEHESVSWHRPYLMMIRQQLYQHCDHRIERRHDFYWRSIDLFLSVVWMYVEHHRSYRADLDFVGKANERHRCWCLIVFHVWNEHSGPTRRSRDILLLGKCIEILTKCSDLLECYIADGSHDLLVNRDVRLCL
jgi:hypothetical protein